MQHSLCLTDDEFFQFGKPGQKIVPKGVPRRNAQPRVTAQPTLTPESQSEEPPRSSAAGRDRDGEVTERQQETALLPLSPPSTAEPTARVTSSVEAVPELRLSSLPQVRSTTSFVITDETPEAWTEVVTDDDSAIQDGSGHLQVSSNIHHTRRNSQAGEGQDVQQAASSTPLIVGTARSNTEVVHTLIGPHATSASPSSPTNSRKRRKVTPETPNTMAAQARVSASPTIQLALTQDRDGQSQSPEDLFRSATSRAASVSQMANSIDDQTRAQRQAQVSTAETARSAETREINPEANSGNTIIQAKRTRKRKTAGERAAEIVADAVGGSSRRSKKRDVTPEDAENYEIDPDEMTMGSLMKNDKIGKKSALEAEMQANWPEILQRRKEDRDKALEAAQSRKRKAYSKLGPPVPLEATVAVGPQQIIVNGKIVVVNESREIDRNAQLTQAAVLDESNVREDKHYYKRVNQGTVGMKASHGRKFRWDDESTQKFYKGLRMFGTDFMMIANMFPGLDRKQIKMKFIREENLDKAGIMAHLQNREEVDLEEYSEVTNIEFQDIQVVEEEMKAEEQRLRAEDNERRKREGFVVKEADVPLPSREGEGEGGGTDGSGTAQAGEHDSGRFAELAADVMAPKKKQRKTNASSKKRGPKAGMRSEGGVEEVLGSIDEVQI